MKVKVTKAEQSTFWYAKHIGKEFEVYETPTNSFLDGLDYKVKKEKEDNKDNKYIKTDDCEIVGL